MSVPAFIDLPPLDQAKELREYLKSIGADIDVENKADIYEYVSDIIDATEVLWKVGEVRDIEGVINSILSLLFVILANCAPLINGLCDQLVKAAELGKPALSTRLLHNFFHGYDINTPFLYDTYCAWLKVAAINGSMDPVPTDIKKVNSWMDMWNCSANQRHTLLRLLYDAQVKCGNNGAAAGTMIHLLGNYTEDNASQAREDAQTCIIRALADSNTNLYDHLLTLKPVKFLEGETIFNLLNIFTSGRLEDFQKFYSENNNFLQEIGLEHDSCVRKMRLLTLIDVVMSKNKVPFNEIQSQLQLKEDELEEFIINAIQIKLINGKIDHLNRKLVIRGTSRIHDMSTFSRDFWNNLNEAQANGSFTYSSENNTSSVTTTTINNYVLRKIEDTVVCILKDVGRLIPPCVQYSSRTCWENVYYVPGFGLKLKDDCSVTQVSLCRGRSSTNFALLLKVLSMIYRLLQANQTSTKRELYYSDPRLFKSQVTLNHLVDDIGCMLNIPRYMLNVVATSKGCVAGDLQFSFADGEVVDCTDSISGVLVPAQVHAVTDTRSKTAKFILVVEKDATFQKLLNENLPFSLSCIMITGKGVPDVNTRQFTKVLSDRLIIPVFGLFDADPHGIEIMCVYRFGSLSLAYDSANLAIGNMRWLGFLPSDMKRLNLPDQALLPFNKSDTRKCRDLMKRPYMVQHPKIHEQVKLIAGLKYKAELQAMGRISPSYLSDVYLPSKLKHGEWI